MKERGSLGLGGFFLIFLLASAALGCAEARAGQKLLVATEGAYAPFNYVASDGSLQGFDVDIAKALCEKIKAECQIVKQDWDGMIPGLLAKKFDFIVASMSITEERKKKVNFTDPYARVRSVIVARKDAPIEIGSDGNPTPQSLKGMKIGIQRSTIFEDFAREHLKDSEVVYYDSADDANLDLLNGRLDVRFDDRVAITTGVLKADGGDKFKVFGKGYFGGPFGEGSGITLRKENSDLLSELNQALKDIRKDGTYKKINDRYFDFDVYGEPQS
jgi:lysine-arginine-ornithine-binding protein